MKRPAIVATPEHVSALRAPFSRDCGLVTAGNAKDVLGCLERLSHEGVPVLLVVLDPDAGATEETLIRAIRLAPEATMAFAREPDSPGQVLVVSPAGLVPLAELVLDRFHLKRRTAEHERHLELVSSAGVAMAASFDILAILGRTRAAAREVLRGADVHLYYGGCSAINARERWYPEGAEALLPSELRKRLERRVAGGTSWDSTEEPEALPIAHQSGCLGALVREPRAACPPLPGSRRRLLEILAQQAATALGNIHSAQERIQFERLSAVGRMIGSIVHDFRSPLTALRGYAGMLHRLDLRESERGEFTGALLDECDRLDHMVDELLQFSRGRAPALAKRRTHLRGYLQQIARRAQRHFGSARIDVALELAVDEEVLLDQKQFERAIWNAVANAGQAMSARGGQLGIRSERLGDRVAIDIDDEGEGIPEEIRHRIFEPFFSHGKSEGIGLGMATAKRITEEHGGDIQIESRPIRGTRVRFLLPLAPTERASEMALPAHSAKR